MANIDNKWRQKLGQWITQWGRANEQRLWRQFCAFSLHNQPKGAILIRSLIEKKQVSFNNQLIRLSSEQTGSKPDHTSTLVTTAIKFNTLGLWRQSGRRRAQHKLYKKLFMRPRRSILITFGRPRFQSGGCGRLMGGAVSYESFLKSFLSFKFWIEPGQAKRSAT